MLSLPPSPPPPLHRPGTPLGSVETLADKSLSFASGGGSPSLGDLAGDAGDADNGGGFDDQSSSSPSSEEVSNAASTASASPTRRSRIVLNPDGTHPPPPPETPDERAAREVAESEELCRQLMAEEAMASYSLGAEYLRNNAGDFRHVTGRAGAIV